jgi:hypothetical protein
VVDHEEVARRVEIGRWVVAIGNVRLLKERVAQDRTIARATAPDERPTCGISWLP